MKDELRATSGLGVEAYWRLQYDTSKGPARVAARRALNYCLEPGAPIVDFDIESVDILIQMGVQLSNTPEKPADALLDVGCSFPAYSKEWIRRGHQGKLYGLDPNTEQFNGLPYWEPLDSYRSRELTLKPGDLEKLNSYYRDKGGVPHRALGRITLIKSDANYIPLPDGTVRVVSNRFSAYHIASDKQAAAFREMKRVQDERGIQEVATSMADNKMRVRELESQTAATISERTGVAFNPPIPTNAGFTSEKATERMTQDYKHVWVRRHRARLVFDTKERFSALARSFGSFRESYHAVDDPLITPTKREFQIGFMAVVGVEFAREGKIEDILGQDMFYGADYLLPNVPEHLERLQ